MVIGIVQILLALLAMVAVAFIVSLLQQANAKKQTSPNIEAIGLGAVTNFFDTLGIGSFAPTTAYMKLRRMAPDSYFPSILNAGHALPTVTQALVFISTVAVNPVLLLACIVASMAGAFVGAPLVQRSPVKLVQGVVGVALLIGATLFALTNLADGLPSYHLGIGSFAIDTPAMAPIKLLPAGGEAVTLPPALFAVAVVGHFVLGVLMMFGIGLYAPSLIMLSLLGLNPAAAFPIMMGACAFLMPVSSVRFVRSERIDLKIVLGLAIGGIPAVLLAWKFFQGLPMTTIRWGVVVVVLYAAVLLLRSAMNAEKPVVQTSPTAMP